jgi:hypothetical protein
MVHEIMEIDAYKHKNNNACHKTHEMMGNSYL